MRIWYFILEGQSAKNAVNVTCQIVNKWHYYALLLVVNHKRKMTVYFGRILWQ